MICESKIKMQSAIEYWAISVFVISMGSLYFQVQRMPLTALMLSLTGLLLIKYFKSIRRRMVNASLALACVLLINTIFNLENGFRINDMIILLINLFFLITIQSNISFKTFKQKYVMIMTIEAIVSFICFLWVDVLKISSLPLQHFEVGATYGFYLTPYYTVGWSNIPIFGRNAGIFNEPGSHQIFLNCALLFLLSDKQHLNYDKHKFYRVVALLTSTILTTKSTTGYMCLAIVLISTIFIKIKSVGYIKFKALTVIVLVSLFITEGQNHVIEDKLEGRKTYQGSYITRYNDTVSGFKIASSKPMLGYGVFQSNRSDLLASYGVVNISNGLASFVIDGGIVLTAIWLIIMYFRIKKLLPYGFIFSLMVFVFYLLCINSEGVFLNPLFLSFLFPWADERLEMSRAKIQLKIKLLEPY